MLVDRGLIGLVPRDLHGVGRAALDLRQRRRVGVVEPGDRACGDERQEAGDLCGRRFGDRRERRVLAASGRPPAPLILEIPGPQVCIGDGGVLRVHVRALQGVLPDSERSLAAWAGRAVKHCLRPDEQFASYQWRYDGAASYNFGVSHRN